MNADQVKLTKDTLNNVRVAVQQTRVQALLDRLSKIDNELGPWLDVHDDGVTPSDAKITNTINTVNTKITQTQTDIAALSQVDGAQFLIDYHALDD